VRGEGNGRRGMGQWRIAPPTGQYMCCENVNIPLGLALNRPAGMQLVPATYIGAGRILKVEGHSGGCNYFGAKRRKKIFLVPPLFSCAHPVFDGIRSTAIKVKQL